MIRNIKKNQGITIISLVVTIIVLLILAGVSLAMVFNQNGIFKKAEQTTDKYGQAKAQETLELMLNEARMQKYERGLTEAQLTEKINTIGRELEKEDETSTKQKIIVEGYIFEIDRSTPKFVKYIGPADGIVITSKTTQDGDWQNQKAIVTGEIKIYGDGTVVSSSAKVTRGNYEITEFPKAGGAFTLENITEDIDIEITATDNKEKTVTKTIEVRLVKDTTGPTLSEAKAEVTGMKIKISVKAEDDISGVKEIKYSVEPKETITPNEGTIASGEEVELTASTIEKYTVTFTAKDYAENPGTVTTVEATTVKGAKQINTPEGLKTVIAKDIYGATVTGYDCSVEGMEWQIFYIDENDDNRVYLIAKDFVAPPNRFEEDWNLRESDITLRSYALRISRDENKKAFPSEVAAFTTKFLKEYANSNQVYKYMNHQATYYMLDQTKWTEYKSENKADMVFGGPTLPIFQASYADVCDTSLLFTISANDEGYYLTSGGEPGLNGERSIPLGSEGLQRGIYFKPKVDLMIASPGCSGGWIWTARPDGVLSVHVYNEGLRLSTSSKIEYNC